MTALAIDRKSDRVDTTDNVLPRRYNLPVAAATTIYGGSMVAVNAAGYAVPASANPLFKIVGLAVTQVINTGVAGAMNIEIEAGAFYLNQAGTAFSIANFGALVFATDDNTVSLSDGNGQFPAAGVFIGLKYDGSGQVAVQLGQPTLYAVNPEVQLTITSLKARAVVTAIAPYTSAAGVLTETGNGALAAQDGVTLVAGDVVFLQAGITNVTAKDAGPYVVTQVGTGGTPFILSRPDWWTSGTPITPGAVIDIGAEGTAWAGSSWKAMCGKGLVIDTGSPLFYPRVVKGQQALTAGAATVSNLQVRSAAAAGSQVSLNDITTAAATKGVLTAGQGTGTLALTGTSTDVLAYVITNW